MGSPDGWARPDTRRTVGRVAALAVALLTALGAAATDAAAQAGPPWRPAPVVWPRLFYADAIGELRNWDPLPTGPCTGAYGDGGLRLRVEAANTACPFSLWKAGTFVAPLRLELAARARRVDSGGTYGLLFGSPWPDSRAFHALKVEASGKAGLAWLSAGRWKDLTARTLRPGVAWDGGELHRLVVELRGRTIQAYVDGVLAGVAQAETEVGGAVGLFVEGQGTETEFAYLRVEEASGAPVPSRPIEMLSAKTFDKALADEASRLDSATCTISAVGGEIRLSRDQQPRSSCQLGVGHDGGVPPWYTIEVDVRLRRGPEEAGYGLRFGVVEGSSPSEYLLLLSPSGRFALARLAGTSLQYLLPWKEDAIIRRGPGALNRLAVEVRDRSLRAYVNGKLVGSTEAPATLGPKLGLHVGTPNTQVGFSRFRWKRHLTP